MKTQGSATSRKIGSKFFLQIPERAQAIDLWVKKTTSTDGPAGKKRLPRVTLGLRCGIPQSKAMRIGRKK